MKNKRKINAKLNLTLDILGLEDKFHTLKSLVCELNIGDVITVKKRKDKRITVFVKDHEELNGTGNNAYKTAKAFMQRYGTNGVDIVIEKGIAIGGGLGGSSADIAGVLLIMKDIFGVEADLTELAESLGSDVSYMLTGGYAVIEGRGQIVNGVDCANKLYFILGVMDEGVSAKECYGEFDKLNISTTVSTEKARELLVSGDVEGLKSVMKNDLLIPAVKLLAKIKDNLSLLEEGNAFMTGSGATVFSVYKTKKERDLAFKRLEGRSGFIKAETVIR